MAARLAAAGLILVAAACGPATPGGRPVAVGDGAAKSAADAGARSAACPAERGAAGAPTTTDVERDPATWLAALPPGEADRVLLDAAGVRALNARIAALADGPSDVLAPGAARRGRLQADLRERVGLMRDRVAAGGLVVEAAALDEAEARARTVQPVDELRVTLEDQTLRCVATEAAILSPGGTEAFDRNRCTDVHAGELVRVRARTPDSSWWYVRVRYASGWMRRPALGPPLAAREARAWQAPPTRAVVGRDRVVVAADAPPLRLGTVLPVVARAGAPAAIRLPTARGFREAPLPAEGVERGHPAFTRRDLLARAFAHLGAPYGWGGWRGGLDCSRFLLDLFGVYGVALPRNSAFQAESGLRTVSLVDLGLEAKLAALGEAHRCGPVIAYMPGHVMLYLGARGEEPGDGSGAWAISSLAELKERCPGGGETLVHLDRVEVTNLAVGLGTSRRSYLERLEKLAVFGACPAEAPAPAPAPASAPARR